MPRATAANWRRRGPRAVLSEAAAGADLKTTPATVVADSGVENVNREVDALRTVTSPSCEESAARGRPAPAGAPTLLVFLLSSRLAITPRVIDVSRGTRLDARARPRTPAAQSLSSPNELTLAPLGAPSDEVHMRMMMKVAIPTDAGNKSIADGSLPRVMGQFIERWKPEGSYFTTAGDGQRCAYFFVDLPDVADIPSMAEPFFMQLHANVIFQPAMNAADMAAGVGKAMQQHG